LTFQLDRRRQAAADQSGNRLPHPRELIPAQILWLILGHNLGSAPLYTFSIFPLLLAQQITIQSQS
jgi:hypothetical protein